MVVTVEPAFMEWLDKRAEKDKTRAAGSLGVIAEVSQVAKVRPEDGAAMAEREGSVAMAGGSFFSTSAISLFPKRTTRSSLTRASAEAVVALVLVAQEGQGATGGTVKGSVVEAPRGPLDLMVQPELLALSGVLARRAISWS